jgi:Leucine-rich repeat (LRR) protein
MSELSTTEVRQIVEEVCQHLVDFTAGNFQRNIIDYDKQDIERERIFKKIRDLYKADERQLLEDLHTASNHHSCKPVWTFRTSVWTSEMGPISKWYESGPYWAPRIVLDSADHVSKLNLTKFWFTFKGQIPSCLTRFSELTTLYLRDNKLTGEICSGLSRLNKLEELDLTDNKFTGDIPPSLGELTNLVSLLLGSNELTGSIPSSFSALKNLNVFDLSHNFLSGKMLWF